VERKGNAKRYFAKGPNAKNAERKEKKVKLKKTRWGRGGKDNITEPEGENRKSGGTGIES